MAEKKQNIFILLALLGVIVLIPLLKAKPLEEPEAGGEVMSTEFTRVNGMLR